jgi:hypothetical protein
MFPEDPNDPNGCVQTSLGIGAIIVIFAVIAVIFGAVKFAKHFL